MLIAYIPGLFPAVFKMKQQDWAKIWQFLDLELLEQFQDPCDNCGYFECRKNYLNSSDIIKNKYKWNDVDFRDCLRRKRKELETLISLLRLPAFKKWSNETCIMCKREFFKHDMILYSEVEKEKPEKNWYKVELFRLCKKCCPKYKKSKQVIHEGFERF